MRRPTGLSGVSFGTCCDTERRGRRGGYLEGRTPGVVDGSWSVGCYTASLFAAHCILRPTDYGSLLRHCRKIRVGYLFGRRHFSLLDSRRTAYTIVLSPTRPYLPLYPDSISIIRKSFLQHTTNSDRTSAKDDVPLHPFQILLPHRCHILVPHRLLNILHRNLLDSSRSLPPRLHRREQARSREILGELLETKDLIAASTKT
jgi:hypothetical protein